MSGYVRIHRALIGHPAFRNDAEAMAFAWLVARAAWRCVRVRYKSRGICLERGQLAISVREFATAMDRDKAWIERLLKRLKSETMVETRCETGVTVITICNYSQYQSEAVLCETVDETPRETRARQTQDTEQEGNEGKKKNRAVGLPDWLPKDDWAAYRKMRKASKAGFTAEAERLIILDLQTLRGEGHCPTKVLQKAIKRTWRGVFGDEDTKVTVVSEARDAAWHEDQARFFDKIGKTDDAAEHRRRATSIGKIASDIVREVRA